jgi:8-oxo-dGTP pyrophosphatase MutT (NUDIX family)
MPNKNHAELGTKLIGEPKLVVVNKHLRYRTDPVRFPNGAAGEYTYIDDDYAAAATVPFDKRRGQRNVLLIRQERYPSQTIGWEIPAGRPEAGETPIQAAIRELREEAGITADHWHQLPQQIENVGRGNSRSDLFVAAGITTVQHAFDDGEVITDQRWFPMHEAEDMMLDGRINAGHTLASIAVANTFVNRNPDHPVSRHAG